jgi:hypothetical protein
MDDLLIVYSIHFWFQFLYKVTVVLKDEELVPEEWIIGLGETEPELDL